MRYALNNSKEKSSFKRFLLIALVICVGVFFWLLFSNHNAIKFLTSFPDRDRRFSPNLISKIEGLSYFQYLPKVSNSYRIVFANRSGFIAEFYMLYKLAKIAETLGWEWSIIDDTDLHTNAIKILNPDLIISIRSDIRAVKGFVNFLYIHSFPSQYIDENGKFKSKEYGHLLEYDGFLQVVPNLNFLKEYFETQNKSFNSLITYLSSPKSEFSSTPKNKLFFSAAALWDSTRSSNRYMDLYKTLDNTDYFVIFGPEETWKDKNYKSYKGSLPLENHAFIEAIKQAGIALILHSNDHIKNSTPTARIFEALAASAIIISDNHPFVKEHFGDSVLYIDQDASSEEMFTQIDTHVNFILSHPEEALQKAKASHQIFIERFTLESELKKIVDFYEMVKKINR